MNTNFLKRLVLCGIVSVFIVSCSSTGGVKIDQHDLSEMKVGVTKRSKIIEKYGNPISTVSNFAGTCDSYKWSHFGWAGNQDAVDSTSLCYDKKGILREEPQNIKAGNAGN